jgi:molybdopterin converting factor small subunit
MDYHRVNFDLRNNGLAVCWGHHEKADGCDYEVLAPQETLKIIEDLRAELEKLKRQWAEDDRDITALEDENNQLRAELAAERKKNDDLAFRLQDWHDSAEKAWKTPCADESHCSCVPLLRKTANDLEAQVEVLMESLQHIMEDHCEDVSGCSCCKYDVATAKNALANLPARAEKVRKVLEAAEEQARLGAETHCDNHSVYFAACADTNKAVRERREG